MDWLIIKLNWVYIDCPVPVILTWNGVLKSTLLLLLNDNVKLRPPHRAGDRWAITPKIGFCCNFYIFFKTNVETIATVFDTIVETIANVFEISTLQLWCLYCDPLCNCWDHDATNLTLFSLAIIDDTPVNVLYLPKQISQLFVLEATSTDILAKAHATNTSNATSKNHQTTALRMPGDHWATVEASTCDLY